MQNKFCSLPVKATACSPENLMGMRLKRPGGPSSVFSLTVAELGFEPRAGYGNAAFIFFFF